MNADQVVNKILSDADGKVKEIKDQAQSEQEAQQKRFEQQLAQFNEETERLAQQKANDEKEHRMAAGRMEAAKAMLTQKREILDEVFDRARTAIAQMDQQPYRDLITRWMLDTVETGQEQVILDKDEKRVDESFIKQVSKQLDQDKKQELTLGEERRELGGGGFVLSSGKVRINVSVNVLLSQVRDKAEAEIAGMLFG